MARSTIRVEMADLTEVKAALAAAADEIVRLRAERDALQAKVDAIDALHQRDDDEMYDGAHCCTCGVWPHWTCLTIRALHPEGDTPT